MSFKGASLFRFLAGMIRVRGCCASDAAPKDGPDGMYGSAAPAGGVLKSPISGRDCVYYDYLIEAYLGSDKWSTVSKGDCGVVFSLRDETGEAILDPGKAVIEVPKEKEYFNGNMRFTEYLIAPGDRVFIPSSGRNSSAGRQACRGRMQKTIVSKGRGFFYISGAKNE